MRKRLVLMLCFFAVSLLCFSQELYYSSGFILSDVHVGSLRNQSEKLRGVDLNTSKIGYSTSLGFRKSVLKIDQLIVDFSLTYQERLPLERFIFAFDDNNSNSRILGRLPTSAQSSGWDPSVYKRLPNFRYLYVECIPTFEFGDKVKYSVGLGLFYGQLLNQNKLNFTKQDFPAYSLLFETPNYWGGFYGYNKHDIGWIPKLGVTYEFLNNYKVGLSTKGYFSESSLNQRNLNSYSFGRTKIDTWECFTFNLDLFIKINANKD